jgi:tetratricopeptide (TPR) repeat protein
MSNCRCENALNRRSPAWRVPWGVVLALWFSAGSLFAALEGWERRLEWATQPMREGILPLAISRLREVLDGVKKGGAEEVQVRLALGRALLNSGKGEEGLRVLERLDPAGTPAVALLRGEMLVSCQRWSEALRVFKGLTGPEWETARVGEAECERALGGLSASAVLLEGVVSRNPEMAQASLRLAEIYLDLGQADRARYVLERLKNPGGTGSKWMACLEGRLALREGRPGLARDCFGSVLSGAEGLTAELMVGAVFGATEARIQLEGYESADRELEAFIGGNPAHPYLAEAFAKLDWVYSRQQDPSEAELQKWVQSAPAGRAALARYYLARSYLRKGRLEKAASQLGAFVENHRGHPLMAEAHLMRADLGVRRRDYPGALSALEAAARSASGEQERALVEFRTGLVQYRAGEFLLAGRSFENAGRRWPQLWEVTLYNRALAALRLKHESVFEELSRELGEGYPESGYRGELALEKGLMLARSGDPRADGILQGFVRKYVEHPRVGEARLALAELAFQEGRLEAAEGYRRVSNVGGAGLEDRAEYLGIFLLESQGRPNEEEVIAQALKFLRERPGSPLTSEVRMKLGETYFRLEDFANAETQLATLAREDPEGGYAETALYLAGQAAMRSINEGGVDRALGYFGQVVKRDGPLKLYAREQQALVQRQLDREEEALKIYDRILAAQPAPDVELWYSVMTGKADALLVLGKQDRRRLGEAVALFKQVAATAGPGAVWRHQALYKQASAQQELGLVPDAMASLYEVLEEDPATTRDWHWYYKAGFKLASLYEGQRDWKAAIGVYEKMLRREGPQSEEARVRVKKLRLEHFVWD